VVDKIIKWILVGRKQIIFEVHVIRMKELEGIEDPRMVILIFSLWRLGFSKTRSSNYDVDKL
jgi:hypothetical protein